MSGLTISIDWGGTALTGACVNHAGLVHDFKLAAANIRTIDNEELKQICLRLSQIAETVASSGHRWLIGAAGGNDRAAASRLREMLQFTDKFYEELEVYPDYLCNHAACLGGTDGILSINGTGSVLFGVNGVVSARMGGWGYLLDETPSAAYFGRRAVEGVLRHLDGESGFEDFAISWGNHFDKPDRNRIIDELYRNPGIQKRLGRYAPVLTEAFASGNQPATTIILESTQKLVSSAQKLLQKLQIEKTTACGSGGLWQSWAPFADIVKEACRQCDLPLTWQPPQYELALGPLLVHAKKDFISADLTKLLQTGATK